MKADKVVAAIAALVLGAGGRALAADAHLAPDGYLMLKPGEQALIHFDEAHRIVLDQVGPLQPDSAKPDDAAPEHLLVAFSASGPMPGASMTVKNGYATGFNYQARMHIDGQVAPTGVCGLVPHGESDENWPSALTGIEVGDFAAADVNALHC